MHTVGSNFGDLIIRVAESCGVQDFAADGIAAVPEDAHDLGKIKRAINEAQQLLRLANSRWKGLRPEISITCDPGGHDAALIDADPARVLLPTYVAGPPLERWSWQYPSGNYGGTAVDVHTSIVRIEHVRFPTSGAPRMISCDRYTVQSGEKQTPGERWFAHIYPTPDAAYVLKAPFRAIPTTLVEQTDRQLFGSHVDQALIAGACAVYFRGTDQAEAWKKEFAQLTAAAISLEVSWAPESVGIVDNPDRADAAYGPDGRITIEGNPV